MKELQFSMEGDAEQFRRRDRPGRLRRPGLLLLLAIAALALFYRGSAPAVTINPPSLDFGAIPVNSSLVRKLQFTNTGTAPLSLASFPINGPNAADFNVGSNTCGDRIAPQTTCVMAIQFRPAAIAPNQSTRNATLDLTDDASDSPQHIRLRGAATPRDDLGVSPDPVDFGPLEVGATPASLPVHIQNKGGLRIKLSRIELTGDSNSEFKLDTGQCGGAVIEPAGQCDVNVSFAPRAVGPVNAELTVTDETGDLPHQVLIHGVGAQPGASHLRIDPFPVEFGAVNLKDESPQQIVRFLSTGNKGLRIDRIDLDGPRKGDFRIVTDGCSGKTVAPRSECSVAVVFRPLDVGDREANLIMSDDAGGDPDSVILRGAGSQPTYSRIEVTPTFHQFPNTALKKESVYPFTIKSTGTSPATIGGISVAGPAAIDFGVKHKCLRTLNPGDICVVNVVFAPKLVGLHAATLLVEEGSPKSSVVKAALEGTGKDPDFAAAKVEPQQLTFTPSDPSRMQVVTVTSIGTVPLAIGKISLDPPSATYFSIKDGCGNHSWQPLTSCRIGVILGNSLENRTLTILKTPRELTVQVVIPYDNDNAKTKEDRVTLRAIGPAPPKVSFEVTPPERGFKQEVGSKPNIQQVTITNLSTEPLSAAVTIDPTGLFFRGRTTCDLSTIQPNSPCQIPVQFVPKASGTYKALLKVEAAGTMKSVTLTGVAYDPPAPPTPSVGWCCVKGETFQATRETCQRKDPNSYFSTDEAAVRKQCSIRIVPVRPDFKSIRVIPAPQPPR